MGQNVISTLPAWEATGAKRGSGARAKPTITIFKGRVTKIEFHTTKQFIVTIATKEGEKKLKIGETNLLGLEKGKAYLFRCVPNTGVGDGSTAKWRVTRKPEPAILSGPSTNPSSCP